MDVHTDSDAAMEVDIDIDRFETNSTTYNYLIQVWMYAIVLGKMFKIENILDFDIVRVCFKSIKLLNIFGQMQNLHIEIILITIYSDPYVYMLQLY